MKDIAIEVKDLKKSFKNMEVLKGVDFEVGKGSIFALLGSNGAGKTSIIRILSTLLEQDGGIANHIPSTDIIFYLQALHQRMRKAYDSF